MNTFNDENEAVAFAFLKANGHAPRHEPSGRSTFPDFDIDDARIGVEVRCLVHTRPGAPGEPKETGNSALWTRVEGLLASLDRADLPTSYVVRLQFNRPLPKWSKIEKAVRARLEKPTNELSCSRASLVENVSISVVRTDQQRGRPFLFGGISDNEGAEFVVASMIESIRYAIEDKNEVEQRNRPHGYDRLRLILVNRKWNDLTPEEIAEISEEISDSHPWERVTLICPDGNLLTDWHN